MEEVKQEATPSPLVYTPQAPKQEAPKSEYVLVEDVTGEPPPKRGPQTLFAIAQNEKKEQVKVQFKVPYPPKQNCKKCYGRGYIGFVGKKILPCRKCFPML